MDELTAQVAGISTTFLDYPDNISMAVIVYLSGCSQNCLKCQSPDMKIHGYNSMEMSISFLTDSIRAFGKKARTNKLVLSGGDVIDPCNIDATHSIVEELCDEFDICIYTGCEAEEVLNSGIRGFKYCKCGPYEYEKTVEIHGMIGPVKGNDYMLLASSNQYWIDEDFQVISKRGVLRL